MSRKVALVVKAAKVGDFFNGFIRKTKKLFAVIYPCGNNMLENSHSVDLLVFAGEMKLAYIKL